MFAYPDWMVKIWADVMKGYHLRYQFDFNEVAAFRNTETGGDWLYNAEWINSLKDRLMYLELAHGQLASGNIDAMMDSYPEMRMIRKYAFIKFWPPDRYPFFGLLDQLEAATSARNPDPDLRSALIDAIRALPRGRDALDEAGFGAKIDETAAKTSA